MSKIRLHGSSSGYTEIAPVAASGNNTITLPNDGTIIAHDAAGAIGVTSVRATNAHFSGTTRVTTGITTTAQITTAKVTTIQDASGGNSSTPSEVFEGRAKAWVNFDGTTNTSGSCDVRNSFNVSSVTDNGTGDYTINFTSALANANYVVCGTSGGQNSTSNGSVYQYDQATAKTTSACRIITFTTSGGSVDAPQIAAAFFGD